MPTAFWKARRDGSALSHTIDWGEKQTFPSVVFCRCTGQHVVRWRRSADAGRSTILLHGRVHVAMLMLMLMLMIG